MCKIIGKSLHLPMLFITFIRLALGGIFLFTGISKIPIFEAFEYSITELLPLTGIILTVTAVTVIAFEIIAGLGLLLNKGTKLLSALLSLMLIFFIISLSTALFRYESYICTCFGVLGLKLPVNEQIVFDFLLLNMSTLIFLYSRSETSYFKKLRERSVQIILPLLLISIFWSTMVMIQPRMIFGDAPEITVDTGKVFDRVVRSEIYQSHLVFFIDIADFLCPQCEEDFLAMGNVIAGAPGEKLETVYFNIKKIDFMEREELRDYIENWRTEHNFPLPMQIDDDDLFNQAGFEKSTVLLYKALGSLEDFETFPMGPRRRAEILNRFLR